MVKFFNKEEEERIIDAIQEVEEKTSGEVRVHLAGNPDEETLTAAKNTFYRLGMHKTRERNGVLFYLIPKKHEFAILGDEGINQRVPDHFWEDIRNLAQERFREGDFAGGICQAVERIGEKLVAYFPPRHDDENELPNEVSYD